MLTISWATNSPSELMAKGKGGGRGWRGCPAKLRMDNGPELISVALADWAGQRGVVLEFIQPGKPTQNSYIESFNRTFRHEVLDFYVFSRLSEVRE